METLKERILAEAQARPQISIALLNTLLPAKRPDIVGAFASLMAAGELVEAGVPGIYRLRNAHPASDTILMMLAAIPRPLEVLAQATRWKPELVRECVMDLCAKGLVTVVDNNLTCTPSGRAKIGWDDAPGREAVVRHGHRATVPPPPPVSKSPRAKHDTERRERLADTFAPVVAAWALHALHGEPDPHRIAQRAYELADAMLKAGRAGA